MGQSWLTSTARQLMRRLSSASTWRLRSWGLAGVGSQHFMSYSIRSMIKDLLSRFAGRVGDGAGLRLRRLRAQVIGRLESLAPAMQIHVTERFAARLGEIEVEADAHVDPLLPPACGFDQEMRLDLERRLVKSF